MATLTDYLAGKPNGGFNMLMMAVNAAPGFEAVHSITSQLNLGAFMG